MSSQYQKVDEIKHPLVKDEMYLVPCIIIDEFTQLTSKVEPEWEYKNGELTAVYNGYAQYMANRTIYPVINHPHNDHENGQHYVHFHVDYRFVVLKRDGYFPEPKQLHPHHNFAPSLRFDIHDEKDENYKLEYHMMKCIRTYQMGIGGSTHNSKLKHNCIYKGKCPHRGWIYHKLNLKMV